LRHCSEPGGLGLRVVGAMKLASGLVLGAAAFGLYRLLNRDLGGVVDRSAARLHLDPENRLVHEVIHLVSGIDRSHLAALSAGTFFYAALHLIEGTGLLLRRRWAEYLTVVATGLLLPLEIYELVSKASLVRLGVLLVNMAIVAYLIFKLLQQRRCLPGRGTAAESLS
jgi:uncharacterized membrane protein (DUF2068 family)